MCLKLLLLDFSAEQAVIPTVRCISARRSTKSPAFDSGGPILNSPEGRMSTFIKALNAVGMSSCKIPKRCKFLVRFSKQLG